ncbi:hypothetical protein [Klenkia terrae]|uniref:Secreted protein n=1 Tax=Klenkia terrae TaxID=1052259 RepID=A0ABU8EAS5_9ACTN|nr:hypothetical protein [Klenkia terrae]
MRTARRLVACSLVLAATSGCGVGAALGQQPATTSVDVAPDPVASPTTTTASAPADPVLVVRAPLGGAAGSDELTVTRGRTQTGLVPPMPGWSAECPVDFPALQYVPLEVQVDGDDLAGHLTVETTAATPSDIGPIGVFFDGAAEPYCQGDPAFALTDTFWSHGNSGRATAYVVLQDAVTPATPAGRPEVFSTLEIRIDHLRTHSGGDVPFTPQTPVVGALCADDPDAVCVSLP